MQERFTGRVTLGLEHRGRCARGQPFPRCCCSRCSRTPSSMAWSAARCPVRVKIDAATRGRVARSHAAQRRHAAATPPAAGIGLRNCRERLTVLYGADASLTLAAEGDDVSRGSLLPWQRYAAVIRVLDRRRRSARARQAAPLAGRTGRHRVVGEAADGLAAAAAIAQLASGRGVPRHPDARTERPGGGGTARARLPRRGWYSSPPTTSTPSRPSSSTRPTICSSPTTRTGCTRRSARLRGTRRPARRLPAVHVARAQTGCEPAAAGARKDSKGEGLQLIDAASIHWLEADDNYVHVHTAQAHATCSGAHSRTCWRSSASERFARIHKSAAVNLAEIQTLDAAVQGRPRDDAARRRGVALEPALQGRPVRTAGPLTAKRLPRGGPACHIRCREDGAALQCLPTQRENLMTLTEMPITSRYDFLDWLRVIAIFAAAVLPHRHVVRGLGLAHHQRRDHSRPAVWPMDLAHRLRMPLLFVIAGAGMWFALQTAHRRRVHRRAHAATAGARHRRHVAHRAAAGLRRSASPTASGRAVTWQFMTWNACCSSSPTRPAISAGTTCGSSSICSCTCCCCCR